MRDMRKDSHVMISPLARTSQIDAGHLFSLVSQNPDASIGEPWTSQGLERYGALPSPITKAPPQPVEDSLPADPGSVQRSNIPEPPPPRRIFPPQAPAVADASQVPLPDGNSQSPRESATSQMPAEAASNRMHAAEGASRVPAGAQTPGVPGAARQMPGAAVAPPKALPMPVVPGTTQMTRAVRASEMPAQGHAASQTPSATDASQVPSDPQYATSARQSAPVNSAAPTQSTLHSKADAITSIKPVIDQVVKDTSTATTPDPHIHKTEVLPAKKKVERLVLSSQIPRIIHHIYKYDISNGPWPNMIWEVAYNSWKQFYPAPWFKHVFWSDLKATNFFRRYCPKQFATYSTACKKKKCTMCSGLECTEIIRADLSRYCILKHIGGIYADLDYEPRTNFYADLDPTKVNLVQSPYSSETFQNSLMASVAHHPYWDKVLAKANVNNLRFNDVLSISGPRLLESIQNTFDPKIIHPLPCNEFQRVTHKAEMKAATQKNCMELKQNAVNDRSLKGIHWGTISWQHGSQDALSLFQSFHSRKLWTDPNINKIAFPASLRSSSDEAKLQYLLDATVAE